MWGLIVVFVIMVVALLLLIVWLMWGVGGRMTQPIADKHFLLQQIAETGQPPAAWLIPFQHKLAKLADDPERAEKEAAIRQQAKAASLRRLDALIKYLYGTTLIESESARSELLDALYMARRGWAETPAGDFV